MRFNLRLCVNDIPTTLKLRQLSRFACSCFLTPNFQSKQKRRGHLNKNITATLKQPDGNNLKILFEIMLGSFRTKVFDYYKVFGTRRYNSKLTPKQRFCHEIFARSESSLVGHITKKCQFGGCLWKMNLVSSAEIYVQRHQEYSIYYPDNDVCEVDRRHSPLMIVNFQQLTHDIPERNLKVK